MKEVITVQQTQKPISNLYKVVNHAQPPELETLLNEAAAQGYRVLCYQIGHQGHTVIMRLDPHEALNR